MFTITILWGSLPEPGDLGITYTFETQKELDAFMQGVEEASGWLDHAYVKEGYIYQGGEIEQADDEEEGE